MIQQNKMVKGLDVDLQAYHCVKDVWWNTTLICTFKWWQNLSHNIVLEFINFDVHGPIYANTNVKVVWCFVLFIDVISK
jgi:hypothetical protein